MRNVSWKQGETTKRASSIIRNPGSVARGCPATCLIPNRFPDRPTIPLPVIPTLDFDRRSALGFKTPLQRHQHAFEICDPQLGVAASPFLIAETATGNHNHQNRRCEIPIWSFSLHVGSDSADGRPLCGSAGHCLGRHGGQLLQGRRRWSRDLKDFRWKASLQSLS